MHARSGATGAQGCRVLPALGAGLAGKRAALHFSLLQEPNDVTCAGCGTRGFGRARSARCALCESQAMDLQNPLRGTAQAWVCGLISLHLSFLPGLLKNSDFVSLPLKRILFLLTFLMACWIGPEASLAS